MTYYEIYVLNRALDGKGIYSISSFKDLSFSELMIQEIKEELINKKILEDYDQLTEEGVKQLTLISHFKTANKYIQIAGLTISCIDDKRGILLQQNKHRYRFTLIDLEHSLEQIIEVYPFIKSLQSPTPTKRIDGIGFDSIIRNYDLDYQNSFILSTYEKTTKKTATDLFFYSTNQLYRYDGNKKKFYETNHQDVIQVLEERMGV